MIISRQAEKIKIKGILFSSWQNLSKEIGINYHELVNHCIFSDLSIGAWQGHWIGRELYKQLSRPFPGNLQPKIGGEQENDKYSYGNTVGELIDNECKGDSNIILSYTLALQILQDINKLKIKWVIIISPHEQIGWERENVQLINFLAQGCRDFGCDLLLVFTKDSLIPKEQGKWEIEWMTSLKKKFTYETKNSLLYSIPGIIPSEFGHKVIVPSDSLVLKDSSILLSPMKREIPIKSTNKIFSFFSFEVTLTEYAWLAAYLQADEKLKDCNIALLQESAAQRFAEGGYDIALRLLNQAKRKTSDALQLASIDVQLQYILIALMNFEEAAQGPLPYEGLPDIFKASLYQSKAWGLVMTGKHFEAESYFEKARTLLLQQSDSKLYQYLLNISALNKLRIGEFEESLGYEKMIEKNLKKYPLTDWHITYINCINQARLYKKSKDFKMSEFYYDKAFSITYNLRNDSDLLYTNLCLAQLEEKQEQHKNSFLFWLRTAIHWLSNPIPEALAPRVVQAITQTNKLNDNLVEQVSLHLIEYINKALNKADLDIKVPAFFDNKSLSQCPSFDRIDSFNGQNIQFALGNNGWSIFVCYETIKKKYTGKEYCKLSLLVLEIVRQLSGLSNLPDNCTILTDHQYGCELPETIEELVSSALRYRVNNIIFGSKKIILDDFQIQNLEKNSFVNLANGIDYAVRNENIFVIYYKRYFKPIELTSFESDIIYHLSEKDTTIETIASHFASIYTYRNILATLRDMEKKHIIKIKVKL